MATEKFTSAFHDLRAAVLGTDAITSQIQAALPLNTIDSLENFEDALKSPKFSSAFVSFLLVYDLRGCTLIIRFFSESHKILRNFKFLLKKMDFIP